MALGHETGFTLLELLVALAIVAVMMTFAIPAFNDFTLQRQIGASVNSLITAVNYARNEAARSGSVASLQAIDASENDNEWGPGYCVTAGDPGSCDNALSMFGREGGAITVDASEGLNGVDSMSFNSRGIFLGAVGTFEICGENAESDPGRVVRISQIGRASVGELTCFP